MKFRLHLVATCSLALASLATSLGSPVRAGSSPSCYFTDGTGGPVVTEIDIPVTEAFFAEPFDLNDVVFNFAANWPYYSSTTFFDPAYLYVLYVSENINNQAWYTFEIELGGSTFFSDSGAGETSTSPLYGSGAGYFYYFMTNFAKNMGKTNTDLLAFLDPESYPLSLRIATQLTQGGPDLCSFTYNFTFGSGEQDSGQRPCRGEYDALCERLEQLVSTTELPNTR